MGIIILILIAAGFGYLIYTVYRKKKTTPKAIKPKPGTRPSAPPVIPGYNEYGVPTKLPNETPTEFEQRENAYYYSQTRG